MAVHPQQQQSISEVGPGPLSVSAEMEAIFLDATGLPSNRAARLIPNRKVRSFTPGARRASRFSVATLGVVAAAALAGLAAGAVILRQPAASSPPPVIALAAPTAAVPAVIEAPAPTVTLAGAEASATDLATPGIQKAELAGPARRAAHARRPSHADLMIADRRLRRAYERAIDAGVPRPVLASYRDRWADLRHDAAWRPDRVQVGYDAMAGDLTRLSEHKRVRHTPPRRRNWPHLW